MGQPGSYYFPFKSEKHPSTNVPGLEDGKQGDYLTDTLTDKAISFIKQNKDQPFFINFWYYTVHTPIQPKKNKLEKYQKKALRPSGIHKNTRMEFRYGTASPAKDRTHQPMPVWLRAWMKTLAGFWKPSNLRSWKRYAGHFLF